MSEEEKVENQVSWDSGWKLFKRFRPYLRPEKRLTLGIGVLLILGVPSGVVSPLVVRNIFDEVLPGGEVRPLLEMGGLLIGLTLFSFFLGYIQALLSLTLRNRVKFRVTSDLFRHLLRLPLHYYDRTESGALMSRVRDDVDELDTLMSDTLVEGCVNLLKALAYFALLLVLDFGLALSGLLLVAIIFICVFLVSKPLRRRSKRAREADAKSSAALHEVIAGIQTVKTSAQSAQEERRFASAVKNAIRMSAKRDVLGIATGSAFGLIGVLGGYVIISVGAYRILMGYSTFGNLFAFFIFLTQLMGSAGSVFGLIPAIQQSLASLERIFAVFDEEVEAQPKERIKLAHRIRGDVDFENVAFSYEEGELALNGVSLRVQNGEMLALVGRSGSGKSTLVHMIPRLYEPQSGRILLDGHPLQVYPTRTLRNQIGVVPQDVFLFNRSIRENIAYATPQATDEEILAAAQAAHVDVFVSRLRQGYDTVVGERGVKLSGGEKQRLAIAREFLRDPPLLILDEATSNLDSESESMIQEALQRLLAGRTSFVIAHRLSTVQRACRIVVMDDGAIVESGSHVELLELGGIYKQLYDKQRLSQGPERTST